MSDCLRAGRFLFDVFGFKQRQCEEGLSVSYIWCVKCDEFCALYEFLARSCKLPLLKS